MDSCGDGLKDTIQRCDRILSGMGLKMPSKNVGCKCNVVGQKNEHQNGIHVWNALELYLETESI